MSNKYSTIIGNSVLVFFIILLVILLITLGYVIRLQMENRTYKISVYVPVLVPSSEADIINNCNDLELNMTALCLKDNIEAIFNYTSGPEINRTFEDIKANGGDCYEYSTMFVSLSKQLGFNATTRDSKGIVGVIQGHVVAFIWSDKYDYVCEFNIDGMRVSCSDVDYDALK